MHLKPTDAHRLSLRKLMAWLEPSQPVPALNSGK